MKPLVLLALAFFLGTLTQAQTTPDSLWISPAHPQPGQQVTVSFRTEDSALAKAQTVQGGLYSLDKKTAIRAQDLFFHKAEGIFQATATVPDTAAAIVANVSDASGNVLSAFALGLYGPDGQPLRDGYNELSKAYSYIGQHYFGMKEDEKKVDEYRKQYWESAKAAPKDFREKIAFVLEYQKDTAQTLKVLTELPLDSAATETNYSMAIGLSAQFKNKPLSEILRNLRSQKFPGGDWKKMDYYTRLSSARDGAAKEQILEEFKKAYPTDETSSDYPFTYPLMRAVAGYYASNGEVAKAVKFVPERADGSTKAMMYNNIAWEAVQKDKDLPEALTLSKASLDTLKSMEATGAGKPPYLTKAQYVHELKAAYATYADTYGFLLYKTGKYKQAFAYETIAMDGSDDPGTAILERYHLFMEKIAKLSKVTASLAAYIEKDKSDSAMEAQYVRLYKGKDGASASLAALKTKASADLKAEMVKTILDEPAADFSLTDLNGNKVSLNKLKGKTVVLDFWATWCGPCKASFPAMQKIVNKHRQDSSVVLLFVDTWENADDKKQVAADFIKQSPYSFHVLLDSDSKVVVAYKVSGIPTKFIIDPTGTLRFKAVGFSGNVDGTADELESMIELAGKQ